MLAKLLTGRGIRVAGKHVDRVEDLGVVRRGHANGDRVGRIELANQLAVVGNERPYPGLALPGKREDGHPRLVHHVPKRDAVVADVRSDDGSSVRVERVEVLRAHAVRTGIGDPHVLAFQTRRDAEAGVEEDRHHLEAVPVRRGDEVLQVLQELLGRILIHQRLKEYANAVQADPLRVRQFPVHDRRIVLEPGLHVRGGIGGRVVHTVHPRKVAERHSARIRFGKGHVADNCRGYAEDCQDDGWSLSPNHNTASREPVEIAGLVHLSFVRSLSGNVRIDETLIDQELGGQLGQF